MKFESRRVVLRKGGMITSNRKPKSGSRGGAQGTRIRQSFWGGNCDSAQGTSGKWQSCA